MAASGTRMTARGAVSAVGKRLPFVLGAARQSVTALRRVRYRGLQRAHPVEPRSALFKSYSGRSYSCSPRALYEQMLADESFAGFELWWVFREPIAAALAQRGWDVRGLPEGASAGEVDLDLMFGEEALEALRRAKIVVWGSREHDVAHARCAYWFANTVIPWHLDTRDGQAYVQAWHGTPLKKLGCDIEPGMANNALYSWRQTHDRYRREGERITHLVTPSQFASDHLCSAMGMSATTCAEKVVEEGYPRNDALASVPEERVAAIKRRLNLPADKKVVLYAPTWRDDQHESALGYTLDVGVDFAALRQSLGDEYVILFRAHYLIANRFDFNRYGGFVRDASAISDVNDLYVVSDLLVTDYSSVFFDYANLGKPMVFYMYDLDHYTHNMRGFYLSLDALPGPIARTEEQLDVAIRAAGVAEPEMQDRYRQFQERFTYLDDGQASERVLKRVVSRRND